MDKTKENFLTFSKTLRICQPFPKTIHNLYITFNNDWNPQIRNAKKDPINSSEAQKITRPDVHLALLSLNSIVDLHDPNIISSYNNVYIVCPTC